MGALTDMPSLPSMMRQATVEDRNPDVIESGLSVRAPAAQAAAVPIVASDTLFDKVMRFNLFPAEYAHHSWLQMIDSSLVPFGLADMTLSAACFSEGDETPARASPMWLRQMSMALLGLRELDRQYDFDYSDTGKRLALLPTSSLLPLCEQAAALLVRPALQRLIRGAEVAAVDAVIGRALRMQTLASQAGVEHLATALTGVLGHVDAAIVDAEAWATLPMQIALSVLPADAIGTRARLRFRFPHAQRRLPRFALSELQRRQLVQVCLVAAQALNDTPVHAVLGTYPAAEAEGTT